MDDTDAEISASRWGRGAPKALRLFAAVDLPGPARDTIKTTIAAAQILISLTFSSTVPSAGR